MDNSDNQNTPFGFVPDKNTNETPTLETVPSWKNNLSKRWSKKQPTKSELCDTFLDMKNSLLVQSNNIIGMNKRIDGLERDLADLIRYINERV